MFYTNFLPRSFKKPTDDIIDLLINDDDCYLDPTHLSSSTTIIGSYAFPTSLTPLCYNNASFEYRLELKAIDANCKWLKQLGQAMNPTLTISCYSTTTTQPEPVACTSDTAALVINDADAWAPNAFQTQPLTPTTACKWMIDGGSTNHIHCTIPPDTAQQTIHFTNPDTHYPWLLNVNYNYKLELMVLGLECKQLKQCWAETTAPLSTTTCQTLTHKNTSLAHTNNPDACAPSQCQWCSQT